MSADRTRHRWLGVVAAVAVALVFSTWFVHTRGQVIDPVPTLLLKDRHEVFLGEVGEPGGEGYGYWPVWPVPPRVAAATIALEDRRFEDHPGVDPLAVARALRQNLAAGRVISGASTLAMQVARMQEPGARSLPNKAAEAAAAVVLTTRYGREAILAQYLRLAPYGNGIHGIAYAARRYLEKPVEDLSWAETAFLCALPQAPGRTNPFEPEGRVRAIARARRILEALAARELLDSVELAQAHLELDHLHIPDRGRRPEATLHAVLKLGNTADRRADLLRRTTLDLDLTQRVTERLGDRLAEWSADGAGNGAVLVVDRASWEVRAYVGSSGYFDPRHSGSIDYARVPRNPGSTLKPFFYAAALDRGVLRANDILDDLGRTSSGIEDADAFWLGPLLPRKALANSRNVPAVEVLERLGVPAGYQLLGDLGLHHGRRPAADFGVGLAVGALPVTLEDLVAAYTSLAGDGVVHKLRWWDGDPPVEGPRLFGASTAALVTHWLADPMARLPSFPRLGATEYPFPVAVKTGTSPDYRDSWAVGWSDRFLVAVWIGDPDNTPMRRLSGFRGAAEVLHDVFVDLHPDEVHGLADREFRAPAGTTARRLCGLSGGRATDACENVVTEFLPTAEPPPEPCGVHVRMSVDVATGLPADARTPPSRVHMRSFVSLPSRYAAWSQGAGLVSVAGPDAGDRHTPPVLRITSPPDGAEYRRDTEIEPSLSSVPLRATVVPSVAELVWYVDGEPFAVAPPPYEVRWPIQPGIHVIEARVPYTPFRSPRVHLAAR